MPACPEASCAGQPSYPSQSVISGNTLVDNGGSVFLWQNSNRYCSDGSDGVCTLVGGGSSGPFTMSACKANLPAASVSTITYRGNQTGSPAADWWNGCLWETENVSDHPQHDRLQPGGHHGLQQDRLARLRGWRHLQRVRLAARPRPRAGSSPPS